MRHLAPVINPVVPALPAPVAGGQLMYQGVLHSSEGTTWIPVGQQASATLLGRALVDVGTIPTPEFMATVSDPRVTVGSRVTGYISDDVTGTGKDADEPEVDVIDVWCRVVSAGQLNIRLVGMTGYIHDKFNVDYTIVKG